MATVPFRILICLGLAATLTAVEAPAGVLAVLPSEGVSAEDDERPHIAGAAVLIAGDGTVLSLDEAVPASATAVMLVGRDGRRLPAVVQSRDAGGGAVLLRLTGPQPWPAPLPLADDRQLAIGATVWSAGNPFNALIEDGRAAVSRGVVSGRYTIAADEPPVRGRGGVVLSRWRGPVIEVTCAINDGNQGGAILDAAGRLVALASLGVARERRVGTAVPLSALTTALPAAATLAAPAAPSAESAVLVSAAPRVAASTVLVYWERPGGPGNPPALPRPDPVTPQTPAYQRSILDEAWAAYHHQQQIFHTDQAVCAVVIDAAEGFLLTAASNLHGEARRGQLLLEGASPRTVRVVAVHKPLDLALLRCDGPLELPAVEIAAGASPLARGAAVGVLGRHRDGGPWTLTQGVVSATERRLAQARQALHQTDALANYGSLGGPVLGPDGGFAGLVVMLAPRGDWPWFTNSGVALFVDRAAIADALPGLRAGASVEKAPLLGLGVRTDRSLRLQGVLPGGPAAEAGLRAGDRIVAVAGRSVRNDVHLVRILTGRRVGESLAVVFERDGQRQTVDIVLREMP